MLDDFRECYRVLEVEPDASPEVLKRAYRDLVKVWHPDRFADDPRLQNRAQEKLKQINLAYGKAREGRAVPPSRPTAAATPRWQPPPEWKAKYGDPAEDDSPPPEAKVPPRRKRNWKPAAVRVGISCYIVFQLAVLGILFSVLSTAFALNAGQW